MLEASVQVGVNRCRVLVPEHGARDREGHVGADHGRVGTLKEDMLTTPVTRTEPDVDTS